MRDLEILDETIDVDEAAGTEVWPEGEDINTDEIDDLIEAGFRDNILWEDGMLIEVTNKQGEEWHEKSSERDGDDVRIYRVEGPFNVYHSEEGKRTLLANGWFSGDGIGDALTSFSFSIHNIEYPGYHV